MYVALGQSALRTESMSPPAQALISRLQGRLRTIECPPEGVGDWQIQGFHILVATVAYADVLALQVPEAAAGVFNVMDDLCSTRLPTSPGEASDLVCRQAAAQLRIGKLANELVQDTLNRENDAAPARVAGWEVVPAG